MGRCIVKLKENKYVEWSSIVDAPTTYVLSRDRMLSYLDMEYGHASVVENRKRLFRADLYGTSYIEPYSMESCIASNRAGDKEKALTLEEILERYDLKNAKEYGDL